MHPRRPSRSRPVPAKRPAAEFEALFALAMADMPWPGAVAVSGGADSLALMHLLTRWARASKRAAPLVLSVDHGLRRQSAADARSVARWAKVLGLACEILTVRGKKPKSDIEAWAREQRYRLMGERLQRHGLTALYVAHHQDDQAETFLLRLARGSGVDGLGAMRRLGAFPLPGFEALTLARPLLTMPRKPLRDFLGHHKQDWLEDPMNDQTRFARNRIRALLPSLEAAGLTTERIADAALHLARAREALDMVTAAVLARVCRRQDQMFLLDPEALTAAPREIGLRALAGLLRTVSGTAYRPRFDGLERLFDRLAASALGGGVTLHGCQIAPAPRRLQPFGPKTLVIARESTRRSRRKT
jgi:tRNA(Ile)-lysidine synthase